MNLLLRLYPRSWRERYGDELAELLRRQTLSPSLVVDLIAGAIDARLNPRLVVPETRLDAAVDAKGETQMFARMMQFRCAGYGPTVTARDQWMSAGVTIGGTLVLTAIWMALHVRYRDNAYVDAFSFMTFLVPYVATLPMTSLKARSRSAQIVYVAGTLLVLTAIGLITGFITSRI